MVYEGDTTAAQDAWDLLSVDLGFDNLAFSCGI